MPRTATNIETELIGRTTCVKAAIAQGYGEKLSLRNFLSCTVDRRIGELQPIVDHVRDHPESILCYDRDSIEMCQEHATLTALRKSAQEVIDDPNYPGLYCGRGN